MKPFIKWAGGKRWLASSDCFELPDFTGRYIEPFLGGAAMFFHALPRSAILSDANLRLIETYEAVRSDWRKVYGALCEMQKRHSKEYYYAERGRKRKTAYTRAAQFLYLNRTCWNGLYRENLKGEFNVPIGTKTKVVFEDEDFGEISRQLQFADLYCCDFEETISKAKNGDLIFADPPYTVAHNLNGFVKYNQKIFSWHDQLRLKACLVAAADAGAKVVLTNADHESIRKLYDDCAEYISFDRASIISGSSEFRQRTSEAILYINR